MRRALAVAYGIGGGIVMGFAHEHIAAWLVAGAALGGAAALMAEGRSECAKRGREDADHTLEGKDSRTAPPVVTGP
jgi:hypothetical protein